MEGNTKASSKFVNFCQQIEQTLTGVLAGLHLNSFLILPVQRLPRYEMLLRDILRNTWKSHPDYASLTAALRAVTEVTTFLNESKRSVENANRMAQLQNKLSGQSVEEVQIISLMSPSLLFPTSNMNRFVLASWTCYNLIEE